MRFLRSSLLCALVMLAPMVPAHADWPFPDGSVLPLLRDDVATGTASAAYRITATGGSPYAFEVARHSGGGGFSANLVQVWRADGTGLVTSFLATGTATTLTRVRITSDVLGNVLDTEPVPPGPSASVGIVEGQLDPGTYIVVMLAGGDTTNVDTLFHIHGLNLTVDAVNFGDATVAGPEQFTALANATALSSTLVVNGHVPVTATRALSGIFSAYTAAGVYSGPGGTLNPVAGAATFDGAPAGSYDFTALVGVTPPVANFSPIVAVADVTLP